MYLRKLLPIIFFILAFPVLGFSQEKKDQSNDKKDPPKVLQDDQQKKPADKIKSVPMTRKNLEEIRLQNKKASMEQMHTINKAIRKSMIIHQRRQIIHLLS